MKHILQSLILSLPLFSAQAIVVDTPIDNSDLSQLAGDNLCALREAVHAINTQSVVDTCDGTNSTQITFATADPITLAGKALELQRSMTISGEDRLVPISGNRQSQIFVLTNDSATMTLAFLALTQGRTVLRAASSEVTCAATGSAFGGAVCAMGDVAMRHVRITDSHHTASHSTYGGALAVGGALTLTHVSLNNNSSGYNGGAVYVRGSDHVSIDNSEFTSNTNEGGHGGAIYIRLIGRDASYININDSYFLQNQAFGDGGAIDITADAEAAHATILRSTFAQNASTDGFGGAIYAGLITLRLENSSLFGNITKDRGSAVYLSGAFSDPTYRHSTFRHNTFVRNTAFAVPNADTGAIYSLQKSNLLIENNILTSNPHSKTDSSASDCYVSSANSFTFRNNLISETASNCFNASTATDNIVGQFSGRFYEDTQCRSPIGVTGTTCPPVVKIASGNPAIDKARFISDSTTDQRDLLRNIDGDGDGIRAPDIGAYEYNALPRIYTLSVNIVGLLDYMELQWVNGEFRRLYATPDNPINETLTFERKLSDGEAFTLEIVRQPTFQNCVFTGNNQSNVTQVTTGRNVTLNVSCSGQVRVHYPAGDSNHQISCPNDGFVKAGEDITCGVGLTPDYALASWGGDCAPAGGNATCTLHNVQSDKNISVEVVPRFYAVTIVTPSNGTLNCTPNPVEYNDDLECTAAPNAGYRFSHWGGDCANVQANTPTYCELLEVKSTKTVSVTFVPINAVAMPFKDSFE